MLLRQKSRHTDLESQQLLRDIDEDPHGVTPSDVADEDSCFFTMGTMQIHHKVARSQVPHTGDSTPYLLKHEFSCFPCWQVNDVFEARIKSSHPSLNSIKLAFASRGDTNVGLELAYCWCIPLAEVFSPGGTT